MSDVRDIKAGQTAAVGTERLSMRQPMSEDQKNRLRTIADSMGEDKAYKSPADFPEGLFNNPALAWQIFTDIPENMQDEPGALWDRLGPLMNW